MATYTITAVSSDVREKNLTHGTFRSYRIHLRDEKGELVQNVEWFRKASSPAPTAGERVEGDVSEGNFGLQFKQAPKAGGGGYGKDPVERAEIRRQNAHAQALRYWELLQARGELGNVSQDALAHMIEWFYADTGRVQA